jgi:hypothetical protein
LTPPVPSSEPNSIFAGDTVRFSKTISDYPATDGWALTYSFRGPSLLADVAATPSGSGYLVTIAASLTQVLSAGTYQWAARVTKAGETYTVARGVLAVVQVEGLISVTHNEKMLAAINAALEGRVVADMQSYTIGGRMVTKIPFKELLAIKGTYEAKVWRDRNPGSLGVPVAFGFPSTDGTIGAPSPVSLPPWYPYGR